MGKEEEEEEEEDNDDCDDYDDDFDDDDYDDSDGGVLFKMVVVVLTSEGFHVEGKIECKNLFKNPAFWSLPLTPHQLSVIPLRCFRHKKRLTKRQDYLQFHFLLLELLMGEMSCTKLN